MRRPYVGIVASMLMMLVTVGVVCVRIVPRLSMDVDVSELRLSGGSASLDCDVSGSESVGVCTAEPVVLTVVGERVLSMVGIIRDHRDEKTVHFTTV